MLVDILCLSNFIFRYFREFLMNSKKAAIPLIGLAWPLLGLGFMSIHFGYLPSGTALFAQALGLFLAGAISGCLLVGMFLGIDSRFSRGVLSAGYVLFSPVGILAALLAPGSLEVAAEVSFGELFISGPLATIVYGNLAIALGLTLVGVLAVTARAVAVRVEGEPQLSATPIRTQE
jgi:hypothetical protein